MKTNQDRVPAVKEGCRIIATTFLSLLLPLSFLLLGRLATARYFLSVTKDQTPDPDHFPVASSTAFMSTLILNVLVCLITVTTLTHCLTGQKASFFTSQRRRSYVAWVLLFLMQLCISLGIFGTVDAEINSYAVGTLVLPRRILLAVGLHETTALWWSNVVAPVVDETVFSSVERVELMSFVERGTVAVAFGHLWWRRLRDEAEALVVLPRVAAELGMGVSAADVAGWWLYYLTVAIGIARVVKSFGWVLTWILTNRRDEK